jgi:hypothetical protein
MKKYLVILMIVLLCSTSVYAQEVSVDQKLKDSACNSKVFEFELPESNSKLEVKITENQISEIMSRPMGADINFEKENIDIKLLDYKEELLYEYSTKYNKKMEVYSIITTFGLPHEMSDTEWDSTYAVKIEVEGVYKKKVLGDGKTGYKPIKVKGKIISNSDPSQVQVNRMDLQVRTSLGRYNTDGSWYGTNGTLTYDYYKNNPSIGTWYAGSPSIDYWILANHPPNYIAFINKCTLERIPTGTIWEVQISVQKGGA